jgi:hypothetical protein
MVLVLLPWILTPTLNSCHFTASTVLDPSMHGGVRPPTMDFVASLLLSLMASEEDPVMHGGARPPTMDTVASFPL